MNELRLTVAPDQAGQRLDRVLREAAPSLSRSALQRAIQAGGCCVDGLPETRCDVKTRVGQSIALRLPKAASALQAEEGHLELLWQDAHLVVCNKPAGLTVHPCPSCTEHTLVQRLLGHFPQLGGLEGLRPGIVHRLDKDTSGLLVVALSEQDRLSLSEAFARRTVHKEYLALVTGRPPAEGECREALGRHPAARVKMAVVPESRGGRTAHTQWRVLWGAPDKRFSLLAVRIHTGRTHQIRVHMAHLGHPLLGDKLYAPKDVQALAPRQMLHAWRLGFTHPRSGASMDFVCPPPDDMLLTALTASRRMRRVVVTGNPGSGKSALVRCLADQGIAVISADDVVEGLYAPGGEAARWIGHCAGGASLLTPQGGVDKAALLAAMQQDSVLRRDVEQVVHALARTAIENFWLRQEAAHAALAVAEVPLYFESDWQKGFCPKPLTVGVRCALPLRTQRVAQARGWSEEKMATIEAWQWPEERKLAACDLVVDNRGSPEALRRAAGDLALALEKKNRAMEQALARELAALWT